VPKISKIIWSGTLQAILIIYQCRKYDQFFLQHFFLQGNVNLSSVPHAWHVFLQHNFIQGAVNMTNFHWYGRFRKSYLSGPQTWHVFLNNFLVQKCRKCVTLYTPVHSTSSAVLCKFSFNLSTLISFTVYPCTLVRIFFPLVNISLIRCIINALCEYSWTIRVYLIHSSTHTLL
jgi:hypothetical protein